METQDFSCIQKCKHMEQLKHLLRKNMETHMILSFFQANKLNMHKQNGQRKNGKLTFWKIDKKKHLITDDVVNIYTSSALLGRK